MSRSTQNTFRPAVENLEGRLLPANTVFVLDYTPDYRQTHSLHSTFFNVRYQDGQAPSFFDFDGDRQVTNNDVALCANEVTGRVRGYFSNYLNYNLSIIGGDALRNDLVGHQWLSYGLRTNATQVSVMYFGGRSYGGEFGRAPLALDGNNVEGFGEVYSRTIALWMQRYTPGATSTDFARHLASTAAHELGHMMGLRHATSGVINNIMMEGRDRNNNAFTNQNVYTSTGGPQNAHHELYYSFVGSQRQHYQVVNYGQPDIPQYGEADEYNGHDDHDHDGCCCHGCTLAVADPAEVGLVIEQDTAEETEAVAVPSRDAVFTAVGQQMQHVMAVDGPSVPKQLDLAATIPASKWDDAVASLFTLDGQAETEEEDEFENSFGEW